MHTLASKHSSVDEIQNQEGFCSHCHQDVHIWAFIWYEVLFPGSEGRCWLSLHQELEYLHIVRGKIYSSTLYYKLRASMHCTEF
jgi:hypothetical protein